jgi:hypothetical protein
LKSVLAEMLKHKIETNCETPKKNVRPYSVASGWQNLER